VLLSPLKQPRPQGRRTCRRLSFLPRSRGTIEPVTIPAPPSPPYSPVWLTAAVQGDDRREISLHIEVWFHAIRYRLKSESELACPLSTQPSSSPLTTMKSATSQLNDCCCRRSCKGLAVSLAFRGSASALRRSQITSAGNSLAACFRRWNLRTAPRRTTNVSPTSKFYRPVGHVRICREARFGQFADER
jgi:hypothetical protein